MERFTPEEIAYQRARIDETGGPAYAAFNVVAFCLSLTFTVLRFMSRRWARVKLKGDDWTIFAAQLVTVAVFVTQLTGVYEARMGYHSIVATPESSIALRKSLFTFELSRNIAVLLVKCSLLLLYLRIFPSRTMRITCWTYMILLVMMTIAFTLIQILRCRPTAFLFDKTVPGGYCTVDHVVYQLYLTSLYAVTDIITLLLPLPVV